MIFRPFRFLGAVMALFFSSSSDAQTTLIAQRSPVTGVELIGSRNPTFSLLADRMLAGRQFSFVGELLPLSVILSNQSTRTIVFYGVRFEYENPAGNTVPVVVYKDMRLPILRRLDQGANHLISVEHHLSDAMEALSPTELQALPLFSIWIKSLREYARARTIIAKVDCVVLDNGRFAGPDETGQFTRLVEEAAAKRDLLDELKRMRFRSANDVSIRLDEIMSEPETPRLRHLDWDARLKARQELAKNAKRRLLHGGMANLLGYLDAVFIPNSVWR